MEITLINKKSSARIITKGAELKSYITQSGNELMWRADPKYWGKTSPFLFPLIGTVKSGKKYANGKECILGKHGFARDNEFSAEMLTENSAVFSLSANDDTKKLYPFDFKITVTYTLFENLLRVDYSVTNNGNEIMPYCIGAHPAFACENIEDRSLVFGENETVSTPVMDAENRLFDGEKRIMRLDGERVFPLHYNDFDNDCVYFDKIKSSSVSLTDKGGNGVLLSWEGFTSLGVWTPAGVKAPFICIEPWCGSDDFKHNSLVFDEKEGIQLLNGGNAAYYAITIEELRR